MRRLERVAMRWFVLAVAVVVLIVVGTLYATGPNYVGPWVCVGTVTRPSDGPWANPTTECVEARRRDRANAWERISGSWTSGRGADDGHVP
jgi:hypothetical protein